MEAIKRQDASLGNTPCTKSFERRNVFTGDEGGVQAKQGKNVNRTAEMRTPSGNFMRGKTSGAKI